ncbi:MAG: oxidoreductase, partial [Ruminococcus sp.]|nr:oxidoreductase [Ruminococcus sp.]
VSPDTRIYSNLSPTMLGYERDIAIDCCIGSDAAYYHKDLPSVPWSEEEQPFGYRAVTLLFERLDKAIEAGKSARTDKFVQSP